MFEAIRRFFRSREQREREERERMVRENVKSFVENARRDRETFARHRERLVSGGAALDAMAEVAEEAIETGFSAGIIEWDKGEDSGDKTAYFSSIPSFFSYEGASSSHSDSGSCSSSYSDSSSCSGSSGSFD